MTDVLWLLWAVALIVTGAATSIALAEWIVDLLKDND